MNTTDLLRRSTIGTRRLLALGIVAFLLLVGAAGWRGLSQAESIGHDFVTDTVADTLTLVELRASVSQLRRAERDLLIAQGNAAEQAAFRAEWDSALARARAKARQLAAARPADRAEVAAGVGALLTAYAGAAGPVFRQAEVGGIHAAATAATAFAPARQLVQAAETDVIALSGLLASEAAGSDQAHQRALQPVRWWFACSVLCAVWLVLALTLPNPLSAALGILHAPQGQAPGARKTPPDDVPTLQPEVMTPDYAGIERRGPDRPQNIVRGEFSPKAASAARKTGPDGADEAS